MKRPPTPALVIGILLLALGTWIGTWFSGNIPETFPYRPHETKKSPGERNRLYLFFSSSTKEFLSVETREIQLTGSPEERAGIVFKNLATGPMGNTMLPLPHGTALLALYIDGDLAVVDLHPAIRENHPGGSYAELHTIYALVNSLVLNVPEIRRVKLLIAGQEQDTLAGHIDIRHPLTANMMIVR